MLRTPTPARLRTKSTIRARPFGFGENEPLVDEYDQGLAKQSVRLTLQLEELGFMQPVRYRSSRGRSQSKCKVKQDPGPPACEG